MATCGLCAEEIKEAALVCRFCGAERTPQGWRRPAGSPGVAATPAPGTPGTPGRTTNGLAIASLVLGILWLYWIGSVLALVFGYLARSQIDASQGTQGGRGLAIAGIVLGWIGVGVVAFVFVLFVLGAMFGA